MFGLKPTGKTEPADELTQRAADLAAQNQELKARHDERIRLMDVVRQRTAQRERAHVALTRIMTDAATLAATSPADLEAAKKALLDARDAETQASEQHAAFERKHTDLVARTADLHREVGLLKQARLRIDDESDLTELVELGGKLKLLQERIDRRRRDALSEWPGREVLPDGSGRTLERGAGLLPNVGFPDGVLSPALHAASGVKRSVWHNYVLVGIGMVCPRLLPAADAEAVLANIKARAGAGRWYAHVDWNLSPPWQD